MTLATPGSAAATAHANSAANTPRRAYLELLLIYAVMFGAPAVLSITDFLTSCGVLSTRTDTVVHQWGLPLYVGIPAAAWILAAILIDNDLTASASGAPTRDGRARWSDTLSPRGRNAARAAMAIGTAGYALAAWNADTLMRGEQLWRWVQLGPVLVLVALALNRHGTTPASIGLRPRRGPRDAAVGRRAFAWSLAGIVAGAVFGVLLEKIALHLDPRLLAVRGTAGPTPPLTASGMTRVLLMSLSAGIGEELILSVLLVIAMTSARQPRWRWLALAGALRIAFHLYLGIWGFSTAIFAAANAAIFARTRRILPLIAAHTFYDILGLLRPQLNLTVVLLGVDWLQLLLALALIPVVLLADRAISALRGRAGTRAPHLEAHR